MNPIQMESLEVRLQMAVTAAFSPVTGDLSILGDSQNNQIVVSRDAAGKILVNGGAVAITGGTSTVANTSLISIFGQAGNDTLSLDESNGALPKAQIFGGDGNDSLTGGSGADLLFGQAGNDQLSGKGGDDLLFGGDGNDSLTGGAGSDQVFGQAGNDRMIWNPGDGTDLNEGGDGTDTVEVNGGNGAEHFTVTANGARVRFDRLDPAPFSIDIGTSENLVLNANGGDDTFVASNGLASLINLTVDGGAGNDSLTGGDGNDMLIGGDGNDFIVGGRGSDVALMGAGDDTFVWNPGDGSDVVEGQDGNDTMLFNGANVAENIDLSANGHRLRFTRDVGNVTMDTNGVETVNLNTLGGADTVHVHDLTNTDLTSLNLDLGAAGAGDGQADTLIVDGTNTKDNVQVSGAGSSYNVAGLHTAVAVSNSEGANDRLVMNLLGNNDSFDASALPSGITQLTVDGGTGRDSIIGSQGADLLIGGVGDDFVDGRQGSDTVLLGADNDTFQWDPGDGSDVVEGQDGRDKMIFNGSNVNENIDISANGSRVRFTRDVGNITMDLNGIEEVDFNAVGGADNVTVNDLTGTDVSTVNVNLNSSTGAGDGAADSVIVNGTSNDDKIQIAAADHNSRIAVTGLLAAVNITGAEPALDTLTVNGLAGNDSIDASRLPAGLIGLAINGGDGNDTLLGSLGNDLLNGGRGADIALMGAGDDIFVWNPGDGSDIVEGQAGNDTLQFNGANVSEKIDVSANGSRVRFTRDVGNITMDLNGVEGINFLALGGADTITVNDLTSTDVNNVNLDLGAAGGGGDGQADQVIVNATNQADVVAVGSDASGVTVAGLFSTVKIRNTEPANDVLTINLLDGDDVLEASRLSAGVVQLKADGGAGNDVLIGSDGNDVLAGGAGDDVLIGGAGQDVLDGGSGNNVVIQD